ncbi:MAG: aminotransferase DegT [Aequorivita sp.]|nr:aminotransferase DegT [Aequorivita sp.]MBF31798.1 aminotransferase DegT [Aequorivita sp.]|tara:strand:- start:31370 stop:32437 length:1068 start_codon:yes stop_codon:yes gene_type:complete
MINVTKTFLPPQAEYNAVLKRAWDAGWITNRGALVLELEEELKTYLKVPNIIAMTNGTLPLQIAIKALGLKSEIITTPFSYVATTSSIVWEGCNPIFVDIHPEYLTIDETKVEAAITSKTTGILATHIFGNPCNVEVIDKIAKKHNLKVIYDAAHCFGVTYKGKSIFEYGDISTCSFHATKVFHTGEGGALFTGSDELNDKLFYHHNFGHYGPEVFQGVGINAKMSELQAAMGLAVLPYMQKILEARKRVAELYKNNLGGVSALKLREDTQWNYSYYPVLFKNEAQLLSIQKLLNKENIFPRRYFYPSLNLLPYADKKSCPISENIASRVLCLPLYHNLSEAEVLKTCNIINEGL